MSRALDFDPFVHPPLKAEQRAQLRAEGQMGPADRELSFDEILDVVNPLQHLPVVGTIYRAITGDKMDSTASIVGSMIYGGPVGLVAGLVNAVVEQASGHDIGGLALAMLNGDEITAPSTAAAGPAAPGAGQTAERPASEAGADPGIQTGIDTGVDSGTDTAADRGAQTAAAVAPRSAPAAAPAASPEQAPVAATPASAATAAPGDGKVLEGKDALAALAADLRTAARKDGTAAAAAPLHSASAQQAAASPAPPPDSFMALKPRDFGGVELATKLNPKHAAGESQLGQDMIRPKGLFPASLSVASEHAPSAAAEAPAADGAVAAGLAADRRYSGEIAPRTNFTARMMEALNKYQALSQRNEAAGTAAGQTSGTVN